MSNFDEKKNKIITQSFSEMLVICYLESLSILWHTWHHPSKMADISKIADIIPEILAICCFRAISFMHVYLQSTVDCMQKSRQSLYSYQIYWQSIISELFRHVWACVKTSDQNDRIIFGFHGCLTAYKKLTKSLCSFLRYFTLKNPAIRLEGVLGYNS